MESSSRMGVLSPMTLVLVAAMTLYMLVGNAGCDEACTLASWGRLVYPWCAGKLGLPPMP